MLPFLHQNVLEKNPQFALLYSDLTTNKLRQDGSMVHNDKLEKDVEQNLVKALQGNATEDILKAHISKLSTNDEHLSAGLKESIDVVSVSLSEQYQARSTVLKDLHAEDHEAFLNSIEYISSSISARLSQELAYLSAIVLELVEVDETVENTIPPIMATIIGNIDIKVRQLNKTRASTISIVRELLVIYNDCIEQCIKILEQAKFGVVSRATKAHARHLALVAESFEGKLNVMHLTTLDNIYTTESMTAMSRYYSSLKDMRIKLLQRRKAADEALRKYAYVGTDMKGIVAEYSKLVKEIAALTTNIKQLEENI